MSGDANERLDGDDSSPASLPGERAQAQMFADILRQEVADMRKSLTRAEAKWRRRCETAGEVEPPQRLVVIRKRLEEAETMLKALKTRYLRTT